MEKYIRDKTTGRYWKPTMEEIKTRLPAALAIARIRAGKDRRDGVKLLPSEWIPRVLGSPMSPYQVEIADALATQRRVVVASANATGKTYLAARLVLWFLNCFKPSVILTTAPTERQVKILWGELKSAFRDSLLPLPGRPLKLSLHLSETHYALGFTAVPRSTSHASGFHSENVLVIVDEASEVRPEIYDGLKGIMASGNSYVMLIGNPDVPDGRFYDTFTKPNKFYKRSISVFETPNLLTRGITLDDIRSGEWEEKDKLEAETIPALVGAEWTHEVWEEYQEGHPFFISRVLGQFPEEIEGGLVPLVASVAAQKLEWDDVDTEGDVVIAVDVARSDKGDDSVIGWRKGGYLEYFWQAKTRDTMRVGGEIINCIRFVKSKFEDEKPEIRVNIDVIGVGAGVVDRLAEQAGELGVEVHGVNVALPAQHEPERFKNLKAELFWNVRKKIVAGTLRLPDCKQIPFQLSKMLWTTASDGRTIMEPKEETRKRLKRSPDHADMLALSEYRGKRTSLQMDWI
jgi:hypothetical protein